MCLVTAREFRQDFVCLEYFLQKQTRRPIHIPVLVTMGHETFVHLFTE